MILNGDLRLFRLTLSFLYFKQTVQTMIRYRVFAASDLGLHCMPMSQIQQHSDVAATRMARL